VTTQCALAIKLLTIADAEVTHISLHDSPLPFCDGAHEARSGRQKTPSISSDW
jgi:hypothetical protein